MLHTPPPAPSRTTLLALSLAAAAAGAAPVGAQVVQLDPELAPLTRPKIANPNQVSACGANLCVRRNGYSSISHADEDDIGRKFVARAVSNVRTGRQGVYAHTAPSEREPRASPSIYDAARGTVRARELLAFENTTDAFRQQRIQLFAHATLTGGTSARFDAHWTLWQLIGDAWFPAGERMALFRDAGEQQARDEFVVVLGPDAGGGPTQFYLHATVGAAVGPYSCYPNTCARQGTADGMHTASVFVPNTPGVTAYATGGFLAEQAVPDWASPQSTVPEPSTVALVGTALATLGVGARRRAGRGARPEWAATT